MNKYKFTGLERDSESNLDHTQFRQYEATQGRWLSPDPYLGSMDLGNPQSLNRYGYVLNAPILFGDPRGLDDPAPANYICVDSRCFAWSNQFVNVGPGGSAYFGGVLGEGAGADGALPLRLGLFNGPKSGSVVDRLGDLIQSAKDSAHTLVCNLASPLISGAQTINGTVGIGIGGSFGIGAVAGIAGNGAISVVADGQKNVGFAFSGGGNPVWGVIGLGAQGGRQGIISNASTIFDLGGAANGTSGSVGPIGLSLSTNGEVNTFTTTVGPGFAVRVSPFNLERDFSAVPKATSTNCRDVVK